MSYSFWEIVENAKSASGDDLESRPKNLKESLLKCTPVEVIQFNNDYHLKLIESYRWDLWGAAYIINGGCSDDGFDYWRDFLISEGKRVFENALTDPESLVALGDIEDVELEEYRYAIYDAYEELTGSKLPENNVDFPCDPQGEEWDEDDLESMFPKLATKYS